MKDFWKFLGKLLLAVILIVLVVVVAKKLRRSDTTEYGYGEDTLVPYYPRQNAKQASREGNYATRSTVILKSGTPPQVETSYNHVVEELKRIDKKVSSQESSLTRSIAQTNLNTKQVEKLFQKINVLNKTIRHMEGKTKAEQESSTLKTNANIFPFAPMDNSCYDEFNRQIRNFSENSTASNSNTTDESNTMNFGESNLTTATCVHVLRNPPAPSITQMALKDPNSDYRVSLAGTVLSSLNGMPEFSVDIGVGIGGTNKFLFHCNPRFSEGRIVLNSKDNDWQQEIYTPLSGMYVGGQFQIVITLQNNIFQLEVNNGDTTLFPNRLNETSLIRDVQIRGDVNPRLLTIEMFENVDQESNSSLSNDLWSIPFVL